MRTTRMRSAQSWAASRRQQRLHGDARKSMIRCLSMRSAAAHAHSTQPIDGLQRAEVLLPADELVQPASHHLQPKQPNPVAERG